MTKQQRQEDELHRYTLRIPKVVFDSIVRLAEIERRSTAKEIELAIVEHVKQKSKPPA